jgi:hypothetical protein
MGKLEKLLIHWINSHNECNMLLSFIIRVKALSVFEDPKKKMKEQKQVWANKVTFKASHGWFEHFKVHSHYHSPCVTQHQLIFGQLTFS